MGPLVPKSLSRLVSSGPVGSDGPCGGKGHALNASSYPLGPENEPSGQPKSLDLFISKISVS